MLGTEELAALLALRPDLAVPPPGSVEELEARAFSPHSVLRALLEADVSVIQLVQLFTILGDKHPRLTDVREMAGEGTEPAVHRALEWLVQRHLVVPVSDDELCVHPAFLSIAGAAALGPPAADLVELLSVSDLQAVASTLGRQGGSSRKAALVDRVLDFLADADAVRDLVGGAPGEAGALARRLATGTPSLPLPWELAADPYRRRQDGAAGAGVAWLLRHGLVYRDSWATAVMPREVGLALRGGHPFEAESYLRPAVGVQEPEEPSPSAAEARAVTSTRAVERLVESLGSRPAQLLKGGGVGVREVRRLAADLEMPDRDVFRLVEIAAAAGLLAEEAHRGLLLPTQAADEWLDLGTADRWWALAFSWLEMAVHPSLAGTPDARGKAQPALAYVPDTASKAAVQRRSYLLILLEAGSASAQDEASLAAAAAWDAPLAWSDVVAPVSLITRWVLAEMELLGLAVDGVPTGFARALVAGDPGGARRLLAGSDADAWEVVLQADLTGLATGRVPSQVRAELTLLADVEGRGAATMYRFSEGSLRRAFDAGRSGEEILDFLNLHAAKGVPQALAYLVGDVERRHGHMRAGRAACYVRFEDPALAAEVLRAKKMANVGLRQIAPTVLVSDSPHQRVLSALRGCGYLPVEESADGTLVPTPVARERAQQGRAHGVPHVATQEARADPGAGRWGLGAPDGDAAGSLRADRLRALAAALLEPAAVTSGPARHGPGPLGPGSVSRVEIPTVLRRPGDRATAAGGGGAWEDRLDGVGLGDFDLDGFEDDDFEDDDVDDEDVGDGDLGDDAFRQGAGPERPTEIVRSREAVFRLLELAAEHEWAVRISYTSAAGKTVEVTAAVLDVSERVMVAYVAPRWSEQKYVLERIGWARVLTEAEEAVLQ